MLDYISSLPAASWCEINPRKLVVLGSTGSIGRSALDVVRLQPENFHIVALAGACNLALLAEQAAEFRPDFLVVLEKKSIKLLQERLPAGYYPEILAGVEGYKACACLPEADLVLSAQVGAAGLGATVAAAKAGKVIALANKESLVLAGGLVRHICQQTGASILPVDSEHNAVFQVLAGNDWRAVARIILTASGGPFRDWSRAAMASITVEDALNHPNWSMGAKITIDSATMMNKGLEVIEACHLYGVGPDQVEVVIHRESIIHSLVEYVDGSQLAQLGQPDMRVPIAHCLGWPRRLHTGVKKLDLATCASLTFATPDEEKFPCLALAKQAFNCGQGMSVVLNTANEVAVAAFLEHRLSYTGISVVVESAMQDYGTAAIPPLDDTAGVEGVLELDAAVRRWGEDFLASDQRYPKNNFY